MEQAAAGSLPECSRHFWSCVGLGPGLRQTFHNKQKRTNEVAAGTFYPQNTEKAPRPISAESQQETLKLQEDEGHERRKHCTVSCFELKFKDHY